MAFFWFLLIAPLVASIAILLFLHKKHDMAIFASVGSAGLCFFIALFAAFGNLPAPEAWHWLTIAPSNNTAGVDIEMGMVFDPLSKGMLLIVTGVGLLVHIFSIGYMAHDPSRGRFFGGLSIFMFSMTGIVLATNLIEMFLFWEGVGLSSYLLIGFWYTKESAAAAANKAFVCNRLADFGFMMGILIYWNTMGTVSIVPSDLATVYAQNIGSVVQGHNILPATNDIANFKTLLFHQGGVSLASPYMLTLMVICLFCGCIGKSAMVPLHVWLPDAMEGPTPVSALIHAATMVAAGVYMLCRIFPLLLLSPAGMFFIASIGCITAIFAALIALQQNDIKRILAYSTLSQLGYMVMAVGCSAPDAAMFHLTTHAFFKALLFLAAGSVIHALHEEQDIWRMGGLWNKIPLTFWTFAIGYLALIGFPGFAGYFSKDYILEMAYGSGHIFYWVGAITAALTAFYMTRLMVVTFFGRPRTDAAKHPHESPKVMTIPLLLLSIPSVIGGWSFIGIGPHYKEWAEGVLHALGRGEMTEPEISMLLARVVPIVMVLGGVGLAAALYWGRDKDPINIRMLANKFYFDEIYDRVLVGGQQVGANILAWLDSWVLEGLIVRGGAYLSVGVGELLRLLQTGSLQTYAFIFSLGGGVLIYFTLFVH